ncbi:hypothetical protein BGW38_003952, partial [Lunasporangiospora selenospora]
MHESSVQEAHTEQEVATGASTAQTATPDESVQNSPQTQPTSEEPTSTTDAPSGQSEEKLSQQDATKQQPTQSSTSRSSTPTPAQPLRRRPRRTGQPLHLLLQDCSKQHITGYLCKKTSEEIHAILNDKSGLAADLRAFSNEFVLTSARDRVAGEVDDEGKELLKDVDPERDVIKQRFEDESSVFKSYDDAIYDIRVDLYFDGLRPRKQEAEEQTPENISRTGELNGVLTIWDTLYRRPEVEPRRGGRSTQTPYPQRSGRPAGPPARPHPYSSGRYPPPPPPPHYGPHASGPPYRDAKPPRDYGDRPPSHEDYYGDRREDYRRGDYD